MARQTPENLSRASGEIGLNISSHHTLVRAFRPGLPEDEMRGEQPLFSGPDGAPRSTVHSGASGAGGQAVDALMLLPRSAPNHAFRKRNRDGNGRWGVKVPAAGNTDGASPAIELTSAPKPHVAIMAGVCRSAVKAKGGMIGGHQKEPWRGAKDMSRRCLGEWI